MFVIILQSFLLLRKHDSCIVKYVKRDRDSHEADCNVVSLQLCRFTAASFVISYG
jgi:hypothetical protein